MRILAQLKTKGPWYLFNTIFRSGSKILKVGLGLRYPLRFFCLLCFTQYEHIKVVKEEPKEINAPPLTVHVKLKNIFKITKAGYTISF